MYPEDRVLIGVINRQRDLHHLLESRWYRIPYAQMPDGVETDYLAFFLSRGASKGKSGVYYYAPLSGVELVRRCDILPAESDHPHAKMLYYKCQMRHIHTCRPPILNPTQRTITFIRTTWDRFADATTVAELYSTAPFYVRRVYSAKSKTGVF
jgi:hypothetical protein